LTDIVVPLDPNAAPVTIGRELTDTVVITSPVVSRSHLRINFDPLTKLWRVVDRSSNGTYTDNGERISELLINSPMRLTLGIGEAARSVVLQPLVAAPPTSLTPSTPNPSKSPVPATNVAYIAKAAGPAQSAAPVPSAPVTPGVPKAAGSHTRLFTLEAGSLRIGRADDNDIVVPDLLASRYHARLEISANGVCELVDTSANGSYVGGKRIQNSRVVVTQGTSIVIGRHTYLLDGLSLVEYTDVGSVTFDAVGLTVTGKNGAVYLDEVSLSLGDNAMLAVLGPSGSGKSTLTRSLTGFKQADRGTVFYDGKDLYANYDELRTRIGYVPQDDILHPTLQVREALRFAAELRFPSDISDGEIENRITEVLNQLGLAEHSDKRIDKLSGGQRKRVSVALELLTKPSMIFLDEPTSGLDPGFERSVMQQLRTLADDGCTIVVVTHSTESLDLCDRVLILAKGGKVAYFGPPADRAKHFGTDDWADIFDMLERDQTTDWKAKFLASPTYQKFVSPAIGMSKMVMPGTAKVTKARPMRNPISQTKTLVRRFIRVIASDRKNLAILLAQAPIVGGALGVIASGGLKTFTEKGHVNGKAMLALLSLVLAVTYMGASNAISEIVKEGPIYRRERAFGLSIPAYITSKVLVLGVLTFIQAAILAFLLSVGAGGNSTLHRVFGNSLVEMIVTTAITGLTAMAIGLFISALVTNVNKASSILPILLLIMYLMSGGPADPHNFPLAGEISYLNSAKWGLSALASSADLQTLNACEQEKNGNGKHVDPSVVAWEPGTNHVDDHCKELWDPNSRKLMASWLALGLIGAVALAGSGQILRRRERKHGLAG
jgi:ABC transport system ATP-binding/permease protein